MADRYDDRYRGEEYRGERGYGYGRDDRGFPERASDEVRSWVGDEEAARRRHMDEQRYGRDWDWGHRMGFDYGRRPARDWSERGHGYGGAERGWSGERWSGEWDRPPLTHRFHNEGRTGYYSVPPPDHYNTPPAGFGEISSGMTYRTPPGYGSGLRGYFDEGRERRYSGQGPRGYQRSDERIREDVCDRLTDDPWVDASEVEVTVRGGEVTLSGSVRDRGDKRRTEDIIESISGVREVHNNLRCTTGGDAGTRPQATTGTTPPATTRR
jgi:osmotically-inducible protein OsmY